MEIKYPIRINKFLALKKIASRREADELIKKGQVRINGRIAVLGDMVSENDRVSANSQKKLHYYAYNKPAGVVTHSPQKGEKGIGDIVKFPQKVFPLGRLDKDSRGLIIMTNDGRMTDKLLNPEYEHEKKYIVRVNGEIKREFLLKMASGVKLDDGYVTKKCRLKKEAPEVFSIILTEGKKRQIRRMCSAFGYRVLDLERVKIMNISLLDIREGKFRAISGAELAKLKKDLGLA